MPKNTLPRSRRAAAPKKNTKTKPTPPKPDYVTQSEISAVVQLSEIADDLAIEIRRRIENGARIQKGHYAAHVQRGASTIREERRHREGCVAWVMHGLDIEVSRARKSRKKAPHA